MKLSFIALGALALLFWGIRMAVTAPLPGWRLHDISGHLPPLAFSLTDDQGHAVSARDYDGKTVLLYFGFAGCSDQCPLAMSRLADILKKAGSAASNMRVLFVTIDPEHDDPAQLRHFLSSFDAQHMTGLTGNIDAIAALAKRYRTAWRPGGGPVAHGNTVYLFDGRGEARLILTPDDKDDAALHDLHRLAEAP